MKIEIPNLPGINLPEFEISHGKQSVVGSVQGLAPKKSNKGVLIAVGILVLLFLGGRKPPTV